MLPRREQFDNRLRFYQTALHELAHATGHGSRLDRHLEENRFGSATYIHEELIAEMAAFLEGTAAGLGHGPGESASYIGTWLAKTKDIRETLRGAINEATKATTLLTAWQAAGFRQTAEQLDRSTPINSAEPARPDLTTAAC